MFFFFEGSGDHRDLHVLTHSFPPRRSSDLDRNGEIPRELMIHADVHLVAVRTVRGRIDRREQPGGKPHERREVQLPGVEPRSEEHTSELQSLMRSSYAVFCLQKKNTNITPSKQTMTE